MLLFATTISAILCFISALYLIFIDSNWDKRPMAMNHISLIGTQFFLAYSILALGYCFINVKTLLTTYPSLICSIISLFALSYLMAFKKIGYYLLWLCAVAFTIGSYWWLDSYKSVAPSYTPFITPIIKYVPFIIAALGSCGMLVTRYFLKKKHNGISMWDKLS